MKVFLFILFQLVAAAVAEDISEPAAFLEQPSAVVAAPPCVVLVVGNTTATFPVTNIIGSFTQAQNLTSSASTYLPINSTYMYTGYSVLQVPYNSYLLAGTSKLGNVSNYMNAVLNQLAAAATNTAAPPNFTPLITAINQAISSLNINFSLPYANVNVTLTAMVTQLNILLNQTMQLQNVGLSMTTAQLLSFIPSAAFANNFTTNLQNLANSFTGNVTNILAYWNATNTLVRSSDNNMLAIETQFNSTKLALYTNALTTAATLNTSLITLFTNINATANNYIAALSPTIKNNSAIAKLILSVNTSYISPLYSGLQSLISSMNSTLISTAGQLSQNMSTYFLNVMSTVNIRTAAIQVALYNTTYLNCSTTFINAANTFYATVNGSVTTPFQCATNESSVNARILNTITTLMNNFQQDFTNLMTSLQLCPTLPIIESPPIFSTFFTYPFTVAYCFQSNQVMMDILTQEMSVIMSNLGQLVQQFTSNSVAREQTCFTENQNYLGSLYGQLYTNFLNCSSSLLKDVGAI